MSFVNSGECGDMPVEPIVHFTPRQEQIAALIASGYSDKQIARDLGVSHRTVRTHIERLFCEHNLHNRAEVVSAWWHSVPHR